MGPSDRPILDALRSATGASEVPTAGKSWTGVGPPFHEEDGKYVARVNGKIAMAVPVNRGRWTAWTDGIYLDANTGDVWVVASARGTHAEASSLAVDDAIRRWSSYVNLACPASAQITSGID